jgi:hypothetical protein
MLDFESIIKDNAGKFLTVTFKKRTNGEIRVMNCQYRPDKHEIARNKPDKNNLIVVWDLKVKDYRSIPIEAIIEVKVNGLVITKSSRKERLVKIGDISRSAK